MHGRNGPACYDAGLVRRSSSGLYREIMADSMAKYKLAHRVIFILRQVGSISGRHSDGAVTWLAKWRKNPGVGASRYTTIQSYREFGAFNGQNEEESMRMRGIK